MPRHLAYMDDHASHHPTHNLNNAQPIERAFSASLQRRGKTLAQVWARTPQEAARRAAAYRLAYGEAGTEIVEHEA